MKRPTEWGEPTEVEIGIYVIDIDEVNSADQSFTASVFYAARWKSPYLKHEGPGPLRRRLSGIWTPSLTLVNEQQSWSAFPEYVEIEPDGTVSYRQKVWGGFSQPLKLQEFPFDKQMLSIHLVAAGMLEDEIKLVPLISRNGKSSGISETFSLPDFKVVSWKSGPKPYYAFKGLEGTAGYALEIEVARRPMYYIMKVILPLCLIVIMSWIPRWIDPKQIGVNMAIATTAFLTLIAYLFAITILLPKVSYMTRIDRFIFLSTILVFAGLIQTAIDSVFESKKEQFIKRLSLYSRYIYPLLLILVLVLSFSPLS